MHGDSPLVGIFFIYFPIKTGARFGKQRSASFEDILLHQQQSLLKFNHSRAACSNLVPRNNFCCLDFSLAHPQSFYLSLSYFASCCFCI